MDPIVETAVALPPPAGPYLVPVYVVYAVVSIGLTIWLARTLAKNGEVFLRDVFEDKPDLAGAVNRLLVVGFYLVNLGYAALIMRADPAATAPGSLAPLLTALAQQTGGPAGDTADERRSWLSSMADIEQA